MWCIYVHSIDFASIQQLCFIEIYICGERKYIERLLNKSTKSWMFSLFIGFYKWTYILCKRNMLFKNFISYNSVCANKYHFTKYATQMENQNTTLAYVINCQGIAHGSKWSEKRRSSGSPCLSCVSIINWVLIQVKLIKPLMSYIYL